MPRSRRQYDESIETVTFTQAMTVPNPPDNKSPELENGVEIGKWNSFSLNSSFRWLCHIDAATDQVTDLMFDFR